jgi:hypothetical protein
MNRILEWINIIMSIKVTSLNYPIEELLGIYKEKGSLDLLQTIFQGSLLSDLEIINSLFDYDRLVFMGVSDLKEIHNMDELKALNTANARGRKSKNRIFLDSFKKENNLMGSE